MPTLEPRQRDFLERLLELLEDFDAEITYTTGDDGLHVKVAGDELFPGGGWWDREDLRLFLDHRD